MRRVLLLLPSHSYRAHDLLAAARAMGLQAVVAGDRRQALEELAPHAVLSLPFTRPHAAWQRVRALHARSPLHAVVGLDDDSCFLAAYLARRLRLPHADPRAVRRLGDKLRLRRLQRRAELPHPRFASLRITGPELPRRAVAVLDRIGYPCVLKPTFLSASRGVLRVDTPAAVPAAVERLRRLLARAEVRRRGGRLAEHLLAERYLPGEEIAIEGFLHDGRLRLLAVFDKPDPLIGPTFPETLYVTPSRHRHDLRERAAEQVEALLAAAGLRHGPVHAEVRLTPAGPVVLEAAPRTIGGLCSRALRAGGIALEGLVLHGALGEPPPPLEITGARGVAMLPVTAAGRLARVDGVNAARAVAGVTGVTICVHRGDLLEPLPEGDRYAGFVFARAERPEGVEAILRRAAAAIRLRVDPAGQHSRSDNDGPPDRASAALAAAGYFEAE